MKSWFEEWFDSPYYHLLYANRDEAEASYFIRKLTIAIGVRPGQSALDLACGKGRHSTMLNQAGLNVVGLDLSPSSIEQARELETEDLHFMIGDMRDFQLDTNFDYIFNIFTSFGYFERKEENLMVLENLRRHLKPDGLFIIDFLNAEEIEQNLVQRESVEREGVHFEISRSIEDGFILKEIFIRNRDQKFHFQERVQELRLEDFRELLSKSGFKVKQLYGSYELEEFDHKRSKRLIIIAEKEG